MNYFNCLLSPTTITEAIIMGIITLIIGKIGFYLSLNDEQKKNDQNQNPNLGLIFFTIGFLLHFIIEIIGLNKWYCDKCIA
jgi:glucose uptake protein GlcU